MVAKRKLTYRITNWRQYNESLVERGSVTVWFSEEALASWRHPNAESKVGRPFVYSDSAIECLLTLRELFKLPYRQTEGFGRSLIALLGVEAAIPDYSSLAKRAAKLGVSLAIANKRGAIDVVAAHFHCAPPGVNGPIAFGLLNPGQLTAFDDNVRVRITNADFTGDDCEPVIGRPVNNIAALALAMQDGLIYINLHSPTAPLGEIRGQMLARESGDD